MSISSLLLLTLDRRGTILGISASLLTLLRKEKKDVIGTNWFDLGVATERDHEVFHMLMRGWLTEDDVREYDQLLCFPRRLLRVRWDRPVGVPAPMGGFSVVHFQGYALNADRPAVAATVQFGTEVRYG